MNPSYCILRKCGWTERVCEIGILNSSYQLHNGSRWIRPTESETRAMADHMGLDTFDGGGYLVVTTIVELVHC